MKTIKLWLTTIATLLFSLTASAHDFEVDGIYYKIISSTDLTVKVTYRGSISSQYKEEYSGAVNIPSSITYNSNTYSVTSIGDYTFSGCTSLTSITLPEGVTSIGYKAFYKCSSLKAITIPESMTSIEEGVFDGCSALTSVTLPKGVTSIGKDAFSGCKSLTSITIPEGVTSIGNSAFDGCSGLTSITIPEGVTSIGSSAFSGCTSLTSVTIPEGMTSIGASAFSGCISLEYVELYCADIGNWFQGNGTIRKVVLGNRVTSIVDRAFYGCSNLNIVINCSNLSISKGSSSYGYVAYYAKSVLNGKELVAVDNYLFKTSNGHHYLVNYIGADCNLVLPSNYKGEYYNIADGALYGNDIHSLTIGSGVLSIGSNILSNKPTKVIWLTNTPPTGYTNANGCINYVSNGQYTNLSNVKIYSYLSSLFEVDGVKYVPVSPSERTCHAIDCVYDETVGAINVGEVVSFKGVEMKVTEIMPYTFFGNINIKEVSVSHLGNIGNQAFYNCDVLRSVEASNKGNIGEQAFYDCDAIESVNISNQGSIGSQVFYGCDRVKTAIIASEVPIIPTINFSSWSSTNHDHGSTSSETYTFTTEGCAVLSFNWKVNSEEEFDKLKVILDGATILEKSGELSGYYSCDISQGPHTLVMKYTKDPGRSEGDDYARVYNITVAKKLVAVGSEAFSGCTALKTVILGDCVDALGDKAFYQCSSLQEIVIPNSVKSVGSYCFSGCSAMKSAVIGSGLKNIEEYTFDNCGLEKIVIGDNITSIGGYAFKGCTRMKSAVLGNGLTVINGTMFNGCIGLEDVEFGNNIRELKTNAFSGCSSLFTITIPPTVTTVGDNVFAGCSKLADVIIADRTTALNLGSNGSSALFADCPLDSVYIGGKITYSTTSSEGYSPFYRNTSLRTIVITDREEQIYDNEFYGCTNLQDVTIGNGVKSIGNYAFSGCSSLEGFSFGRSMKTIGTEAFSDCTNLTAITSYAVTPPVCGSQALDDINKWSCVLKVPVGSLNAYMVANQWKEFFFIEDDVVDGVENVIMDADDTPIYNLKGMRVSGTRETLPTGIYIQNGKKFVVM